MVNLYIISCYLFYNKLVFKVFFYKLLLAVFDLIFLLYIKRINGCHFKTKGISFDHLDTFCCPTDLYLQDCQVKFYLRRITEDYFIFNSVQSCKFWIKNGKFNFESQNQNFNLIHIYRLNV